VTKVFAESKCLTRCLIILKTCSIRFVLSLKYFSPNLLWIYDYSNIFIEYIGDGAADCNLACTISWYSTKGISFFIFDGIVNYSMDMILRWSRHGNSMDMILRESSTFFWRNSSGMVCSYMPSMHHNLFGIKPSAINLWWRHYSSYTM
jgi:hypothetical protein